MKSIQYTKIARKLKPLGYILIGAGIVFYLMGYDFNKFFYVNEREAFIASIVAIGYGMAILILNYLGGEKYQSSDNSYIKDELSVLRNSLVHGPYSKSSIEEYNKKIKKLEESLKNIKEGQYRISEKEKKQIIGELKRNILSDASSSILSEIETKYSEKIQTDNQLSKIQDQLENTRLRLREEISALGRRGNVNLLIGILTTFVAISILTTAVLSPEIKLTNENLISHFAPRFTLSLFIEIFSFFFLKLYKSSLNEIKYFQNELTNIEMKFVSLDNALRNKNKDLLVNVINDFSKTERNLILNKGQSTVDIERSRIDSDAVNNTISSIFKLTEAIKR